MQDSKAMAQDGLDICAKIKSADNYYLINYV